MGVSANISSLIWWPFGHFTIFHVNSRCSGIVGLRVNNQVIALEKHADVPLSLIEKRG